VSAIDLIIARGFGPEVRDTVTGFQRGKDQQQAIDNEQRYADQRQAINDFNLSQSQQNAAMGRTNDARLTSLLSKIPALDAALQASPNDPQLRQQALGLYAEIEAIRGPAAGTPSVAGALLPQAPQAQGGKILSPQEAAAYGLRPGTVVTQDASGNIRILQQPEPAPVVQSQPAPLSPVGKIQADVAAGIIPPDVGAALISKATEARPEISPKDRALAKNKLAQIRTARMQLQNVRDKWQALEGSSAAGPMGLGKLPTPAGRAFDAAVNAMRDTVTSLTRVPGVGAMSDFETRLAMGKFPDRNEYEAVTAQQIEQLDQLISSLEAGYQDVLGDAPAPAAPPPALSRDPAERPAATSAPRQTFQIGGATVEILD
jgi:hypothetical protein